MTSGDKLGGNSALTSMRGAILAPMSGVTDVGFRRIAHRFGASLVVSEMVASRELVHGSAEALLRAEGTGLSPHVVQLAGCEARWLAEGARVAEASGATIIDINMGCPARRVTGGWAGLRSHARSRSRNGADRGGRRRRRRAGDSQDAPRLGRRDHQRAGSRSPRRLCRNIPDHRPWADAPTILQGQGRLGGDPQGQGDHDAASRRQWRHRRYGGRPPLPRALGCRRCHDWPCRPWVARGSSARSPGP